jgi:uncharacterized protein YecE (DUF72 family)
MPLFIGTAGWTVPKQHLSLFSEAAEALESSHLHRYARRLRCVEINSSFHRPHRRSTWQRWAAETPANFRFAVKAPKAVTHTSKLVDTGEALQVFFHAAHELGEKLGPVLVQLPPKLEFDEGVAREFFGTLRELHQGNVALEPRNPSWFSPSADRLLRTFEVSRVAADPPKGAEIAGQPGGSPDLRYWRLHGAPRTYYSGYDHVWLRQFADRLISLKDGSREKDTWVIFDNTAMGHAAANAVWLEHALRGNEPL